MTGSSVRGMALSVLVLGLMAVMPPLAGAKSFWECEVNGQVQGWVLGYDQGAECDCRFLLKGKSGSRYDYSYKVTALFAGFGCKGYCIKDSHYSKNVERISREEGDNARKSLFSHTREELLDIMREESRAKDREAMQKFSRDEVVREVQEALNACRNRMWMWRTTDHSKTGRYRR